MSGFYWYCGCGKRCFVRTLRAMPYGQGRARLNDESLELIISLAGKGATNGVIAAAVGIHTDTFQAWLKKGRDEMASYGEDVPKESEVSIYARLTVQIEYTRAMIAADMAEIVINTAKSGQPNTWQAAMTFLERRYPGEWGKRETTVHEGQPTGLPAINVLVLNDPNARSLHRDLLRSVDASNRPGARLAIGPGVDGEREAGSADGEDDLDVDTR